MKKTVTVGLLSLSLLLGACSDPDTETMEKASKSDVKKSEETKAKAEKEEEASVENGWKTKVGDTVDNEGGTFTLLARQDKVAPIKTGPVTVTIPQVNKTTGTLKGSMKEMLESDVANYIQIDMEVENTTDDTVNFYPDQATITTNTGEQVEAEMLLSDSVGGEFIGKVKKEGSVFFFLKQSKAEDVEWVRILIDAPSNKDYEFIGEEVDVKVEF